MAVVVILDKRIAGRDFEELLLGAVEYAHLCTFSLKQHQWSSQRSQDAGKREETHSRGEFFCTKLIYLYYLQHAPACQHTHKHTIDIEC